jgi:hypothetical protein
MPAPEPTCRTAFGSARRATPLHAEAERLSPQYGGHAVRCIDRRVAGGFKRCDRGRMTTNDNCVGRVREVSGKSIWRRERDLATVLLLLVRRVAARRSSSGPAPGSETAGHVPWKVNSLSGRRSFEGGRRHPRRNANCEYNRGPASVVPGHDRRCASRGLPTRPARRGLPHRLPHDDLRDYRRAAEGPRCMDAKVQRETRSRPRLLRRNPDALLPRHFHGPTAFRRRRDRITAGGPAWRLHKQMS